MILRCVSFLIQYLQTFQQMIGAASKFDSLVDKRDAYNRALPPLRPCSSKADNGVTMAPNGSLVTKGNKSVLLGEEYLILGHLPQPQLPRSRLTTLVYSAKISQYLQEFIEVVQLHSSNGKP
jgi:hypothetical protein